jgi:rhodanese-related sulfurtransferase
MPAILALVAFAAIVAAAPGLAAQQPPQIDHAIAREADPGRAPQITTAELRDVLARDEAVVLDARPVEEFGMSHIPGAMNVSQKPGTPTAFYISDVAEVKRLVPDRARPLIVYCNGPFCGKSRRFADELVAAGYLNVRRYQLGMPGWRTAGGVSAIEPAAIHRVAELDATAVFIDAGLTDHGQPMPRMVKLRVEEVTRAKDDGRLPMHDHNTRIIVLGATPAQARAVAEAIAANAFHNVAYYDGDGSVLQGTR